MWSGRFPLKGEKEQKTEDGRQKTEDGGHPPTSGDYGAARRTDDRGQKTEDGRQPPSPNGFGGPRKTEDGRQPPSLKLWRAREDRRRRTDDCWRAELYDAEPRRRKR